MFDKAKRKKRDIETITFYAFVTFLVSLFVSLHANSYQILTNKTNFIDITIGGITSLTTNPMSFKFGLGFLKIFVVYVFFSALWGILLWVEMERVRDVDVNSGGHSKWYPSFKQFSKQYEDNDNKDNNILLTENVHLSMNSSVTRRNNNVLVVGGSGSGKTRFMIKPNIMQANCSFVITDPKGEILETQGEMLKKNGYKIKVFNLVDMEHSNSYNPFKYIRDDNGVMMLINCLIKNTNNGQKGGDPFWEKSETALLQALIFYLKDNKALDEDCKNFSNVMKLLRAAEVNENDPNAKSPLDLIFEKVETENPNSIAVKQYKTFKMGAGKTLKSILISCAVRLTVFNLPSIEDLTMKDDLELEKMGDQKTALFVVIPAADDTYNFLVSMMYSQLFETLYYRAENECPYEYYLKDGVDVLAIAKKNPRGDEYTKQDAKRLLIDLKKARPKQKLKPNRVKYFALETKNFTRNFDTMEDVQAFKERLGNAEIVKGKIRLPYPVRFLLDEFANIGQIPDFTKKLATMRQYEISCTIILQNLAQIKTMYKDDWESIVGNCDSFLFLGGQEYSTLEYISKLLGKTTVKAKSSGLSLSKNKSRSQNFSNQGQELMTPSEISTMPNNECILIIRGIDPFKDKKLDLTKHKRFNQTGDSEHGSRFDNKKETFNYGYLSRQKLGKNTSPSQIEKEVDNITGKGQTFNDKLKETRATNIKEAVNRIILKKGEVVVKENKKEDESVEYDYNVN